VSETTTDQLSLELIVSRYRPGHGWFIESANVVLAG